MSVMTSAFRGAAVAVVALVLSCGGVLAQSVQMGCTLEQVAGAARRVLHCGHGLTIVAEKGARFDLLDRNGDGQADGVALRRKALLIEAPPALAGGRFEVITPQAIAAVRGTKWAVDAETGKTSVFVARGRVAVRRVTGGAGVSLGPGQGVDVAAGTAPLQVRRWPAERVSALLARLGQ